MTSEAVHRASPAVGQVAPYRWYVFAACTALAVALNYVFGKEMASTDLAAWVGEDEEAWAKGPLPIECGRRHGSYFARLMQAGQ